VLPNRAILYLEQTQNGAHNAIWMLDTLSGVRYRLVQRPELAAFDLAADGQTLVYQAGMSDDARLYLLALHTSQHEQIAAGQVECPRWSPDGKTILYQNYREFTLYLMDAASRESSLFLYLGSGIARCSHDWAADGNAIIHSDWMRPSVQGARVVRTDITTLETTPLFGIQRPVRQLTVAPDGHSIAYNGQTYATVVNVTNREILNLSYFSYTFSAAWSPAQDYMAFGYQKPLLRAADGIQRGIALIDADGDVLFQEDVGTVSHVIWWVGQ
jgi:Tol biopolymer transport system component